MTPIETLLGHDAWTTEALLDCCEGLSDAQLDEDHGIGPAPIRGTFMHVIRNMEVWAALLLGEPPPLPPVDRTPSVAYLKIRLGEAADALAEAAQDAVARGAWNEEWLDTTIEPPKVHTRGATIAHVITHSMHHRAQLITMLRRAGVQDVPEGDVLAWERRPGGPLEGR